MFLKGVLMAPAGTAGGGAGAGAAPAGDAGGAGAGAGAAVTPEVAAEIGRQVANNLEKFKTEGLGAVIDAKLSPITTMLSSFQETMSKLVPPPAGAAGGEGNRNIPPELNVTLKNLEATTKQQGTQIETLKKEKLDADLRAEKSERHSIIRTALNNMHYISEEAAKTAFTIVEPHIKRMDDGLLIGGINGDNFPVEAFVKDFLTKEHPYLLRASGVSGSGAPSSGSVGRMGIKADLADIRNGMKPETREQVVASISAALATIGQ